MRLPQVQAGRVPLKLIAGIIIVLVIGALLVWAVIPGMISGSGPGSAGVQTPSGTLSPSPTTLVTTVPLTTAPTPTPDPFPGALRLREGLSFGAGRIESEGTVYRIWTNQTYHWHNDMDNKYYVQKPAPHNKYLFAFINVFNKGDTRVWPPTSGNIHVWYNEKKYSPDPTHYLPDKSSDRKATAIEVAEIQYFPKLFGTEYVEDFGYPMVPSLPTYIPVRAMPLTGTLFTRFRPRSLRKKPMLKLCSTEIQQGSGNSVRRGT